MKDQTRLILPRINSSTGSEFIECLGLDQNVQSIALKSNYTCEMVDRKQSQLNRNANEYFCFISAVISTQLKQAMTSAFDVTVSARSNLALQ